MTSERTASIVPLFLIVTSYSIASPFSKRSASILAVSASHVGATLFTALPVGVPLVTFVILTSHKLVILVVPFIFKFVLKAAYPALIKSNTKVKLSIIIFLCFLLLYIIISPLLSIMCLYCNYTSIVTIKIISCLKNRRNKKIINCFFM